LRRGRSDMEPNLLGRRKHEAQNQHRGSPVGNESPGSIGRPPSLPCPKWGPIAPDSPGGDDPHFGGA
ncbi:MAG TPA: hypothetical protein V6D46_07915, partial [Coleofasciculaceae cyanobacterium]